MVFIDLILADELKLILYHALVQNTSLFLTLFHLQHLPINLFIWIEIIFDSYDECFQAKEENNNACILFKLKGNETYPRDHKSWVVTGCGIIQVLIIRSATQLHPEDHSVDQT